ncbi:MAG TPA: serine kinase [Bacteroidales bacterium]|nr:serine kinase [Bacteroidales bacterium]
MRVSDLVERLELEVYSGEQGLSNIVSGGYTSDLLSDVMGNASEDQIWITLQTHKNVLAVASLKDLAAIVLVKGFKPDADMEQESNLHNIPVLGTNLESFEISALLYNLLNKQNL